MNILGTIQGRMNRFSKGQKRIARYILDHCDKAAFMTASRLGETVQVSESTVVRFASEVGCDGYPGLQRALQDLLRSRLTAAQRFRETDFSGPDLLGAVVHSDMEKLRQMAALGDRAALEEGAERILGARRVYILGVRSSCFVAGYLHFYLHLLLENVSLVQPNAAGEMYEQLFRIGPGDALIAVSFPRYSRITADTVKFARDRGASILAVTDGERSPVYALADTRLLAPCEMISFVDSMVAPLSLMNALLVALARRMDAGDTFSQLEEIWNAYGVFGQEEE